jgi:hypothetical protein
MSARRFRPDEATVRLYESIDEGAVLDLPLAGTGSIAGNLGQASDYLRLHAYHRQPVAPCNNTFLTPVPLQINAIASQLPARAWKLDAVQALGFRFIVVHPDRVPADRRDAFLAALERLRTERTGHAYLVPVGGDGTRSLYRIDGQPEVQSALDSLSFEADGVAPPTPGETANFVLRVRNDSPTVFVQAEPVEPTRLLIRWYSEGAPVGEETVSALLPLALAAGDRQMVPVSARAPAASGDLIASISLARRPEDILAKARMVRN